MLKVERSQNPTEIGFELEIQIADFSGNPAIEVLLIDIQLVKFLEESQEPILR
jgi:hypothetical protein